MDHRNTMMELTLLAAAVVLLLSARTTAGYQYHLLGSITIPNPSFVELLQCGSSPHSLWITDFSGGLEDPGRVYTIANVSSFYPDFSSAEPTLVSSDFKWPNKVSAAPKEIGDYVVVPDGFLIPWKSTGGIYLLGCDPNQSSKPIELSARKEFWFYHMVEWRDMNGDGKLDVLTARATKPLIEKSHGELLWLEQPPEDPLTAVPWKEHVLVSGPDVIFLSADLDENDEQFEVFACEFFSEKLSMVVISTTNASVIGTRDIDTKIGPAYDAIMVDLNLDGNKELVVTNHVSGNGGSVYAYTIPKDVLSGNYTKYTIATNFSVTESGSNQAAPGYVYTFQANSNYTGRPYLLVAGDGSQRAYILQPMDKDFAYSTTVLLSVDGVVGTVGYGNILPGGWAELFVPDYDEKKLYAFAAGP